MERNGRGVGLLALSLLTTGCVGGGFADERATFEASRPLSATGELSLENTNGSIHVSTWNEPRVRIEATKRAPSERALDAIEILVDGDADRLSVRTRLPRGGFPFHRGGSVEYDVTVPRGARVALRDVNGRVQADGVAGGLRASTVNGSVEANDVAGEVEATTVNGSVDVKMAALDPAGHNRFSSTNGSVRVTLPRDAAADVSLRTVNGSAHCEFDLAAGARTKRREVEGRVGAGGARVELRTVNGSTRLERGLASAAATRPPAEAPAPR